MSRRTIAAAMRASKTARTSIDKAREILQHQPRNMTEYRRHIARRYDEFNRECRGVAS